MPPGTPIVLVIEDEPILRMMAADLVKEAGFDAIEAVDADDAVRILENRPDIRIVFTDIDMPRGLDGMKLATTIRDRWPLIEIIIVSGRHRPRPEDMPARGVFLTKPYKAGEVVAELRRMAA